MTQPEALRLAAALDERVVPRWVHATGQTPRQSGHRRDSECVQAAAELRRLHAEVKRLALNGIHTCHAECQRPLCKVTRERDALLEALELAADFLEHSTEFRIGYPGFEQAQAKARAAIAKAEEA